MTAAHFTLFLTPRKRFVVKEKWAAVKSTTSGRRVRLSWLYEGITAHKLTRRIFFFSIEDISWYCRRLTAKMIPVSRWKAAVWAHSNSPPACTAAPAVLPSQYDKCTWMCGHCSCVTGYASGYSPCIWCQWMDVEANSIGYQRWDGRAYTNKGFLEMPRMPHRRLPSNFGIPMWTQTHLRWDSTSWHQSWPVKGAIQRKRPQVTFKEAAFHSHSLRLCVIQRHMKWLLHRHLFHMKSDPAWRPVSQVSCQSVKQQPFKSGQPPAEVWSILLLAFLWGGFKP